MNKILLFDANLLMFRSFYAATAISKNPSNLPTHLFFNTVFEIIKEEKPNYIFFAFDANSKTKRHEEFTEYKAGRTKAPEELFQQKNIIINILEIMKLKWFEKPGDEADDIIASISEKYKNDNKIFIISEDRDLLQLIDNNITVIQKNRDKNINSRYVKINDINFKDIYKISPIQITDYKGIAGDTSDNLTGIKGIGPKTATDLLLKFQNLEGIYQNINQLTEKQQKLFKEFQQQAFMCKKLATLNRNVDLGFDINDLKFEFNNFIHPIVFDTLEKYELRKIQNIIKELINEF